MRHIRLLAGIGVLSLLLSLVALVPARVGVSTLLGPDSGASGLSGTVWRGTALHLSIAGVTIGPVNWQVKPWRLLRGQVAAAVEATVPDGFLNGTVAFAPGGSIAVDDLEAAAPLALLTPSTGAGGGQVAARLDSLAFEDGHVGTAVGTLKVAGFVLPVPTTGTELAPGTYSIVFDARDLPPDEPLTGTLTDEGGPLEIAATLTLTPPATYEINGTAKPRPGTPDELREALKMLGPATEDGGHALSIAGSF